MTSGSGLATLQSVAMSTGLGMTGVVPAVTFTSYGGYKLARYIKRKLYYSGNRGGGRGGSSSSTMPSEASFKDANGDDDEACK